MMVLDKLPVPGLLTNCIMSYICKYNRNIQESGHMICIFDFGLSMILRG